MNPRANIEDIYPLSPAQEGILFHSLYEPGQGAYVEQLSCELGAELDVQAFRSAWQLVVDHYPALRTAFVWDKRDKPFQVALRRVPLALRVSDGPIDTRAERAKAFDLGRAPLMRVALAPAGAGGWHLVWTWHHIILDRYSVTLVLEQVLRAYEARRRGAAPSLPASRPYRDYVDWLRKQDLSAAESFWRRELEGYDAPVPLPFERRAAQAGMCVRTLRREFPAEIASEAAPFAARCRVSLNTLIEGAWALTLGRYTGAGRVVWGRAVLGRPPELAGAEAIPGLFINTVPVVAALDRAAPVREWLRSFQERQNEARAFEYAPLSSVQGWSGVPRGEALFDVLLVFLQLHQDSAAPDFAGLGVRNVEWFEQTSYGVSAGVAAQPRLVLQIDFDAARFAEDDVERLSATYFQIVGAMLRQPERPLGLLPALTPGDTSRLTAWNATDAAFPVERTFSDLFEEQARRAPDAVAVECPRERLAYGELMTRAARLARVLDERGVGAEDVVAILMPRSSAFLVSVLGIFRAGAAYVPLDPHHPSERLLGVLRRSRARVAITDGSLDDRLSGSGVELLHAGEAERGAPTGRPCPRLVEAAAYVIYTSGSTGVPKGAVVEQRGMVNHVFAKLEALGMDARDGLAQTASQCFDISVWQFLAPLLVGARVSVFPDELGQDPVALTQALVRQRVSVLELVPAQIRALLDEPLADLGPVRELLSTGEALDPELARRCRERYPHVRLLNAYGPTECSDDVAHHVVVEADPSLAGVPIGRPVPNIRLYVLDREREPVPPGAVGELYVGGVGVGRGYLDDPGRTAEAFLPDHLGPLAGRRLYRTGDAARLLRDDTLDFLGRLDDQVKVRGYRIELGEIETALKQHPDVSDAAAAVTTGPGGEQRLVACVRPARDGVTLADLRPSLQRTLPAYMIPAALVQVPALPRSSNGKLDRKAVARLAREAETAPAGVTPPRTPTEETLARIWAAALETRGPVGVDANFFEIGGDSILSIQVASRAAREGLRFTVRQLFENPTIAELAAAVDRASGESAGAPDLGLPQLAPREAQKLFGSGDAIEDSYPLSPMQQGMLFYDLLEPEAGAYNVEISVSIEEPLDEAALVEAWRATLAHHAVFRTSFVFDEREEPLQAVHAAVDFPIVVEDWRGRGQAAQEALIEERLEAERARRFDLRRAPLTRVVVIRRADAHFHLIWTYHHILLDGWSWPLVFRDLFAAYAAASEGRPIQLPAPRPFRDHIAWLRQQDADAAARFWREELAGLPPRPPLDVAAPPAGAGVSGYRAEWTRLSAGAGDALRALARARRVTLSSVFQAAWSLWLASRTDARDLVFGVAVAGRPAELAGVDQIVGPFINALPLRVRFDSATTAATLLSQLHAHNARVRQFEYAPLARIAGWAGRPSGEPLFETFVAFQNYPVDPSALGQGRRVAVRNPQSAIRTNNPLTLGVIPGNEIALYLLYDAGRFGREAVVGVLDQLSALLDALATSPEAVVGALVEQARAREKRRHMSKSREGLSARLRKISAVQPKLVQVSAQDLVRTAEMGAGPTPLLLFEPRLEGVNLAAWLAGHRDEVETRLGEHGALLFRGFGPRTEADFGALARSLWPGLLDYTEGSTPRSDLGNQVYTSTEYPADQSIPLHNEMSYSRTWPMKIAFCAIQPAASGGETPIADSRRVYARIDPAVRARFADKGVMYVRNFGEGLDVPWQKVFRTGEPAEVERHCREHGIRWEWLGGDRLRTRQVSQAVFEHPVSREPVWFNQAHLFHVSNLEPAVLESLLAILPEEELPRNAYYGDGTPIEGALLEEIRQIYREESTRFPWRTGDVMLLDNVRVAHGRLPFGGPRRIVVAMAEAWSNTVAP